MSSDPMSSPKIITFRCPKADTVVTHQLDDPPQTRQAYEAVMCSACGELHFVHRDSGKLLGHERE